MTLDRKAFLDAIKKEPYEAVHHKAYADWLEENDEPEEADFHRSWTLERFKEAEAWLIDKAYQCGATDLNYPDEPEYIREITYQDLIDAGYTYVLRGDYFSQLGRSTAQDVFYGHDKEFWENWKIVTGERALLEKRREEQKHSYNKGNLPAPFSCSC